MAHIRFPDGRGSYDAPGAVDAPGAKKMFKPLFLQGCFLNSFQEADQMRLRPPITRISLPGAACGAVEASS